MDGRMMSLYSRSAARGNVVNKARSILGLAGLILVSLYSQSSMATVVGTCRGNSHLPTIQSAIAATPAGGTVNICPGTYTEQISVSKHLTLTGVADGGGDVVIAPPAGGVVANSMDLYDGSPVAAQIVISGGSIVNLNNLIIDGSNNQINGCAPNLIGIYYQNSSGSVKHVVARNQALIAALNGCQSGEGIFVESGYTVPGTADVTITASSVHSYQKNGITVDGAGTTFVISGNYVVGAGPTSGAAENGIQVSDGATGSVLNNKVIDDIYTGPIYGAGGILVYDSGSITIQGNTVSDTQLGITVYSDGLLNADQNMIVSNTVSATHLFDAIDVCSNDNVVKSNTVFQADGAGVHIDSTCTEGGNPTGNGNSLTGNVVNEACAGVLQGTGSGNTLTTNNSYNVLEATFAGDVCPTSAERPALARASGKRSPQPSR